MGEGSQVILSTRREPLQVVICASRHACSRTKGRYVKIEGILHAVQLLIAVMVLASCSRPSAVTSYPDIPLPAGAVNISVLGKSSEIMFYEPPYGADLLINMDRELRQAGWVPAECDALGGTPVTDMQTLAAYAYGTAGSGPCLTVTKANMITTGRQVVLWTANCGVLRTNRQPAARAPRGCRVVLPEVIDYPTAQEPE
jgi:hypothetical protein